MKPAEPKYRYRFACGCVFTALAAGMFCFVWYRFVSNHNNTGYLLGLGNLGMALGLYLAMYVYFGRLVRAFGFGVERKFATVAAQIIALLITDVTEVFISLAITGQFRFFWMFTWRYFLLWCVQSVVIGLLTSVAINIYRKRFPPLQLLEIYGDYEDTFWQEVDAVDFKYHIKNRMHYSEGPFGPVLSEYDAVLINNVPARPRNDILKLCFARNKRLYFVPKISDIITRSADSLKLFDTPLFLCRNRGMSNLQWVTKRVMDIVLSGAALIVLSPVFAVTALAIKLNDGGPVFYKQERATKGGKPFMILKFRSMIVDAEKDGRTHPAGENDDRITKVGHIIRPLRIDELPQLWNILIGDMSIVGPRPERLEHVQIYTDMIPEFPMRNKAKGGLTGYAQVYGKYNTSPLNKLKMDLIYITNYSLVLDLQIILETLKILLRKESTEGFSDTSAAALHDYTSPPDR